MRDISLLEQKKLQWAKEKEELSKMNDIFAATTTTRQFERTSIRTYYSNVDVNSSRTIPRRLSYCQEQCNDRNQLNSNKNDLNYNGCRAFTDDSHCDNEAQYQNVENLDINHSRAPILPPIGRNNRQKVPVTAMRQNQFLHQNTDEDTSGYLSDRMSPLMWTNQHQKQSQNHHHHSQHLSKDYTYTQYIYPSSGDELAPEMNAMNIDHRRIPKHKSLPAHQIDPVHEMDFSIPKTPSSMCSDNRNYSRLSSCPPSRKEKDERAKWGDRNNHHFYDIVSKESTIKSDGPGWLERGFIDSGDESVRSYSFIRGQNVPIDPNVLAERTTKRIKAIELQNAIKAQVEERERLRKMELEQCLMEERRQEEKMRQQMESNEQRFEEEQRKMRDKIEREKRKQEMMRIAIEKARQEAEMEKAKKKRSISSTIECQSAELDDVTDHDDQNTTRLNKSQSSDDAEIQENAHDTDDGEKILIGTPIKMRKKTLKKPKILLSPKTEAPVQSDDNNNSSATSAPVQSDTNVDGIALVLQTLPPIMPILSNDIMNLNQNINSLNTSNIQLAVMLAHQMQQLNTIAQNQNYVHEFKNVNSGQEMSLVTEKQTSIRNVQSGSAATEICKQCTGFSQKPEMISMEDQTRRKDAATVTDDFETLIPQFATEEKIEMSKVNDASTQTDNKLEYCFQCRFHQCHHHHHVIEKDFSTSPTCREEVKTVPINHMSSKGKNLSTESKDPIKIEDRPKWGVNRPIQQYVKASQRDPFYLRNKRKKHQKRQFTEEQCRSCDGDGSKGDSTPESRSISPCPSIITNSTVTLSSPQLKNRKRSICTEILPIKTDMNGRVYLNFNGASLHVTEDEQRSASKRQQKPRIINRSQTANEQLMRNIN